MVGACVSVGSQPRKRQRADKEFGGNPKEKEHSPSFRSRDTKNKAYPEKKGI